VLFRFDPGLALFAVVTVYLLINATWSLDLPRALDKASLFGLIAALSFAACRALGRWDERQIKVAVTAFLVGMVLGLLYVLHEAATKQEFMRALYDLLPALRPNDPKTVQIGEGEVVSIAAFELNRNVAVLLLMLWPALLCLSRLTEGRRCAIAMTALFALSAVVVFISQHETSKLGFIAAAIAFATAWFWPRPARLAMLALWCLAFVLVVPLSIQLGKEQVQQTQWLPYSARSRVTLWAYTARKIPEAPILGIGLTSTRKQAADRLSPRRQEPLAEGESGGPMLVWKTGPHSHNEFLQTWYELGAVGAILMLAAGCAVILSVGRLTPTVQPFILAQFAAFFVTAAFSWGMWQSWLMALTGLAALYAAMAASFARAELPVAGKFAHTVRSPLASGQRVA
jgi:O-antigen ligase